MRAVALVALALSSGCMSTAYLGGGRTLRPGQVEVSAAPTLSTDLGTHPVNGIVQARVGVTDRLDVGLRGYAIGGQAEARYQLHRSEQGEPEDGSYLVALRLGGRRGVVFVPVEYVGVFTAQLFIVGEFRISDRWTAILANDVLFEASAAGPRFFAGAHAGLRLRLLPWLRVVGEATFMIPFRLEGTVGLSVTLPGE